MAKKSGIQKFFDELFSPPKTSQSKRIMVKPSYKWQKLAQNQYSDYNAFKRKLVRLAVEGKYQAFLDKLNDVPNDPTYSKANNIIYAMLYRFDDVAARRFRYAKYPLAEDALYNKLREVYTL